MTRSGIALALAFTSLLAANVLAADTATVATDKEFARGKLLFLRCSSCHDVSAAPSAKIGPNLSQLLGRKAGSLDGFAYSPAMLSQRALVWDAATLDRWLANPAAVVPGTSMAFAGVPEAADRKALLVYLSR